MSGIRSLPQDRVVKLDDAFQPILVHYRQAKRYFRTKSYQGSAGVNWIECSVHHEGVLKFAANAQQLILDALFDAVEGAQFLPVNYQSGSQVDSFLVRNCTPALDKLFKRGLQIKLESGTELNLTIWFNVAEYHRQQISPILVVSEAVDRLLDNLEHYKGVPGVLNLRNFSDNPHFKHFVARLSNVDTLHLVCKTIYNNDNRRRVNGFNLASNQIRDLSPLKLFGDVDYGVLDLTGNLLSSTNRLCEDLQRIRVKQLLLADNPVTKSPKYPECLKPLAGNFEAVDGVPFDQLDKIYTPLNNQIDIESDGVRIDWSNKERLAQFKDSKNWHAFLIPDLQHEFTKDDLFDYFFLLVSTELSEFYPCYYRYDNGVHRFLVRECYDQIEYLAEACNLTIKIPQLMSSDGGEVPERSIAYYLRMDVSTLTPDHVQPKQCIEQALQKRFNAINRALKLEHFQSASGLENVIVCLTSPRILNTVLRMASRKFLGNCVELRLGNNKILGLNNLRSLALLSSLQALDLGHNWICDLDQISALSEVPLKSLRLHGNSLCQKYSLPSEYIRAVKNICPGLQRLDDVDLSTNPGLAPQKDFLCDTAGYELTGELFIQPFLREFETTDKRINLARFYTDNSVFTLTSSCDIDSCRSMKPSNELFKRLNKYNYFRRNLLKNSLDTCRIHVGVSNIMEVIMQLPEVSHDFVSLQTDVMNYDDHMAVICVNGVLRDEPDLLLAFSRQFVLVVDAVGLGVGQRARRMKISNERFNIMNPTSKQLRDAFRFVASPAEEPPSDDKESLDVKEHQLLIFQELTGLRPKWCTRIVQEEADWDFQLALEHFLRMEAGNELPDDAFA